MTAAGTVDRGCTPTPTSGGPQLLIGGGSIAAARRAGRFGSGLIAQAATPGMNEAYEEACREAGHEPAFLQLPEPGRATAMFVADDVDQRLGRARRHLLHDAMTAASYRHGESDRGQHQHRNDRRRSSVTTRRIGSSRWTKPSSASGLERSCPCCRCAVVWTRRSPGPTCDAPSMPSNERAAERSAILTKSGYLDAGSRAGWPG